MFALVRSRLNISYGAKPRLLQAVVGWTPGRPLGPCDMYVVTVPPGTARSSPSSTCCSRSSVPGAPAARSDVRCRRLLAGHSILSCFWMLCFPQSSWMLSGVLDEPPLEYGMMLSK